MENDIGDIDSKSAGGLMWFQALRHSKYDLDLEKRIGEEMIYQKQVMGIQLEIFITVKVPWGEGAVPKTRLHAGYWMSKAFSTASIEVFKYPVQYHNIY